MSSLAEVSNLLVEQNTVLGLQASATMNTNKEIKKLTGYFTGLDAEERQREASAAAPAIDAPSVPGETEGRGFTTGMLITPGVLLDLAKKFGFRLLKGGLIVALADNIGKAIAEFLGAEEFQGEITRALTFAGIGSIFGKKFALIGAALGVVLDQETLDKITPIISEISNKIKQFAQDYLPSIETLQAGLITGLEGVRNLLQGNFKEMWEGGQVEETLLLLAGLGAVLMPGKALAAAIGSAKLAWAPVTGIFNKIAGLGNTVAASGGAMTGMSRAQQMAAIPDADLAKQGYTRQRDGLIVDKKTKTPISNQQLSQLGKNAGKGGLLRLAGGFLTGPAGAIIGISTLGYIAATAFMTTDLYKSLKKRSDLIEENLNEGVEGQGSMSTEETAISMQSLDGMSDAERVEFYKRKYDQKTVGKDLNAFGGRTGDTKTEAIINAPQTNSSSSSSVVQNNSVMNSGTSDPSDQLMLGGA